MKPLAVATLILWVVILAVGGGGVLPLAAVVCSIALALVTLF